jgi:hypothetical protein
MNKEDFEREVNYESRMALARTMLRNGFITKEEYCEIDTIFLDKFRPLLGSLRAGFTCNAGRFE